MSLRIIPLGGLGEIGLNLMVLEYEDCAIAVDCGVMFPDAEMMGVDVVIPDLTYLRGLGGTGTGATGVATGNPQNGERIDRKSTRLNSSHTATSRMPSSA